MRVPFVPAVIFRLFPLLIGINGFFFIVKVKLFVTPPLSLLFLLRFCIIQVFPFQQIAIRRIPIWRARVLLSSKGAESPCLSFRHPLQGGQFVCNREQIYETAGRITRFGSYTFIIRNRCIGILVAMNEPCISILHSILNTDFNMYFDQN